MRILRLAFAFSLLIATPARAASGYDLSDLWWSPGESGWGIELVQQRDVIFATLFVYDAGMQPTWYSATLDFQGLTPQTHTINYRGDLYRTTGPWFGAATPFDSTQIGYTKVGVMSIAAPSVFGGTLTYNVGDVVVTKPILRQTFRFDDYNGDFVGTWQETTSKCPNPADNGTSTQAVAFRITQAGTAMSLVMTKPMATCTFAGTYGQDGRLGRLTSMFSCSTGEVGAATFEEMSIQRFAVMGRVFGADSRGCHIEGTFAAVGP